jgi:hypothetical protein
MNFVILFKTKEKSFFFLIVVPVAVVCGSFLFKSFLFLFIPFFGFLFFMLNDSEEMILPFCFCFWMWFEGSVQKKLVYYLQEEKMKYGIIVNYPNNNSRITIRELMMIRGTV